VLTARVLVVLVGAQAPGSEPPRAVIRHATAAVEGDSITAVAARWRRTAAHTPPDRSALLGLATLARLTYAYASADSLYGLLSADSGSVPDAAAVYAALGRGFAARMRGAQRDAARWFERAWSDAQRSDDRAAQAEALVMAAATRARTAGPVAAESLFARARALAAGDPQLEALYYCGHAELLALSYRPAGEEARRGAELAQRVGDGRLRAGCRHLDAADRLRQGDISGAADTFALVAAERRALRDRGGLASTLQWRGAALNIAGWLQEASHDFEAAVAEARVSGNESAAAWALSGLAWVAVSVGDVSAATAYAANAARKFAAQGDRYGEAGPQLSDGAVALAAGQLERASAAYQRAVDLYEPLGFASGTFIAQLGLAHVAMRRRDWAEAERHLLAAQRAGGAGGQGALLQGLRYHRATLAMRRGQLAAAKALLTEQLTQVREAARRFPNAAQPTWEYFDATRLAELHVRRGELRQAEDLALSAAAALDRWRDGLTRRELRLQAYQVSEDLSDPDLGTATIIAALVHAGRVEPAFHLAERLRARELLDRLARAEGLGAAETGRDTSRQTSPLTRVAAAADLAAALPDSRTALLEFATGRGGEPTTVFALTRDSLRARVVTPVDSLELPIERFSTLLESGADPRGLARELGAKLLDAVLAALPDSITRIIVVPDGALHRLPFEALVLADGRFLIERYAFGIAPSATVLASLRRAARTPGGDTRILALGDPTLPGTSPDPAATRATPDFSGAARLPGSRREARLVARFAPAGTVRLGAQASEAWLKQAPLADYRVLHFATHARADEATLTGSAIALAPGGGEDGLLGPGELGRLRAPDLVVLSACQSGGGVVVRGEGIVGLAAPLIQAGARAVALTRWTIGDRPTVTFIEQFYQALAAGEPAADALRTAKLAAIARGAAPADWAAFTIVGDPSITVPLTAPRGRMGIWVRLLGAALVAAGLLQWRRARARA
jgi:hypothetical protein